MKIAVASAFLGHIARGVETWANDLATELARRGMQVTLFKGGGAAERPFERRVRCADHQAKLWQKVTKLTRHGGWWLGLTHPMGIQQVTFALNMIGPLRRGRYDIVHMQDYLVAQWLEWARQFRLHRAKVILGHGTEEDINWLLKLDHVQELAPYYLEQHRQRGLPADRLWFAIPNFVDCQLYSPGNQAAAREKFQIPKDRFVVLEVAALKVTHKRLDWLAREVALLRQTHPNALLVVAGATTSETPQVRQAIRETLGDNAMLLTDLRRSDMPDLYRAANVFAHGALTEMLPIALLEALASGLPIVANKYPTFEWIVGSGGAIVDLTAPGNMAAAIAGLMDHPGQLTEKSKAARQHALERFETTRVVDQIVAMYREVLRAEGRESRRELEDFEEQRLDSM